MKGLPQRAVFVTMVPLALGLAALGVREATREPFRPPTSDGRATEFVPPALFLAASAGPGVTKSMSVVAQRSSARVVTAVENRMQGEQILRAEGTLRILADGTIAEVELDLAPRADARTNGWPRDLGLHLRGVSARCSSTAVPGVHACALRCSVVIGGASREATLAATWIRMPGGLVELHAVAPLDWAPFDLPEPWFRRMLPGRKHYDLGLDLVLRADG